jgi:hypothetical protein
VTGSLTVILFDKGIDVLSGLGDAVGQQNEREVFL